jgi:predicted MFS family arabinose efflux permease
MTTTAPDAPPLPAIEADRRLWPLVLGNFAVGTGALIVTGLLPAMSREFGQSSAVMGQTVTAFAIAVAIGGPLLAGPTSRLDRARLLQIALAMTAIGHLICAAAPNVATLLLGRIVAGLGAGLFTPHASTAAALLVGPERRGRAIALVFIGFTVSTVAGVPLGTWLAEWIGWRGALDLIVVVSLVALAWVRSSVPSGLFGGPIDAAAWRQVGRSAPIRAMLATTLLQSLGQFVLLTYIAAVLLAWTSASQTTIALLFVIYGLAGVVGNVAGGRFVDRLGAGPVVAGFIVIVGTGLAAFPLLAGTVAGAAAVIGFWGLGAFAINSVQQPRLIAAAPAVATATLPLNSAAIYVGQALGAIGGAAIVAGPGYTWLGPAGAIALAAALVTSRAAGR